ncbi:MULTISPECIES: hypothetical protein [Pseudomonas]|uniref:Uncharacterized protein n=1 Tax=Pseudomonas cedrina TaxID=651740 RepID=A0A2S9D5F7_PSECE|nr:MULTISPECIES: hypothetical protein [Pseudomonas]AVJ22730.1 hypothetical protein CLM72_13715 [Pseudomonas sp. MYb193]PRB90090.1 hypothetical protein CQ006_25835 [Pseudomonas cedrina]
MSVRTIFRLSVITVYGLALMGCATTATNPHLVEARALFTMLRNKPESDTLVANEVRDAFSILIQADLLSNTNIGSPQIEVLSQAAKQKIALAEQLISASKTESNAN